MERTREESDSLIPGKALKAYLKSIIGLPFSLKLNNSKKNTKPSSFLKLLPSIPSLFPPAPRPDRAVLKQNPPFLWPLWGGNPASPHLPALPPNPSFASRLIIFRTVLLVTAQSPRSPPLYRPRTCAGFLPWSLADCLCSHLILICKRLACSIDA